MHTQCSWFMLAVRSAVASCTCGGGAGRGKGTAREVAAVYAGTTNPPRRPRPTEMAVHGGGSP